MTLLLFRIAITYPRKFSLFKKSFINFEDRDDFEVSGRLWALILPL